MKLSDFSSTVRIPTSPDNDFFKYWLIFLRPLHHLTDREIDLATAFLKKRYELSKSINNDDLLDKIVLNEDYKKEIREEVGITNTHFQVIMGKLRNNKFIENNKINPKFIPRIKEENGSFLLLIYFDFNKPVVIDKLTYKKKEEKKEEPKKIPKKRGRKKKVVEQQIISEIQETQEIQEEICIDDESND